MLAFFNLSGPHLLVILVVALLLFGSRLPEVARSIGRAIQEFKKGLRDVNEEIEREGDADRPPQQLHPPSGRSSSSEEPVSRSRERDPEHSVPDERK